MAVIDLKAAEVTIEDGGSETAEVILGEGNLTFTETVNREYRLNRGKLNTVKNGDEEPMTVNFDMEWEYLTGTGPTVYEALKGVGGAVAWATSDTTDPCAPYAINVKIVYTPDCATGDIETIIFPDFRYENINGDIDASQLSVDGKCNATEPTAVRTTQP